MDVISEVGPFQLGRRLAQLREQSGVKQAELARSITWSQAVLSRVEAGERPLTTDELGQILSAIGTPAADELAQILSWTWRHLPRPPLDHPDHRLLWDAESMVAQLRDLAESSARPAFTRRIEEYVTEVERFARLLLRREHQVAFIGSIGTGKSTAICRATDLEIAGPEGKSLPVLETGAGGVTLCEVRLRTGPRYGVSIVPRTHEDIRLDVADLAEQLRRPILPPDRGDDEAAPRAVPREIERAIRNMAGLAPRRHKDEQGKFVRVDPATALAAKATTSRELVIEIMDRLALHQRDSRDAWMDADDSQALEWLKSMFEAINNGRHPGFSLPERIDLFAPVLIDVDDLVLSIIDTRGIDQLSARADLEPLLDDPHTVSLLCSNFNAAPENSVQHLLTRAGEAGNRYVEHNAAIVILPRASEALAVKDEGGFSVESAQEGYELKEEQVRNALEPLRLGELPVLFFNAFEDAPYTLRTFIADRVASTREGFRQGLQVALGNALSLIENAEQEQVLAAQLAAAQMVRTWMFNHPKPGSVERRIHDALIAEISSAHPSTIHAAVRRDGEWSALSYSHQLGFGARRIAVAALANHVNGFTELCETIADAHPEARDLPEQASRLMEQTYQELLRKMQLAGITVYRDQLQRDGELWGSLTDEWGRGSGYRERVAGRNREWFDEDSRRELERETVAVLEREWTALLGRIASIFDMPGDTPQEM